MQTPLGLGAIAQGEQSQADGNWVSAIVHRHQDQPICCRAPGWHAGTPIGRSCQLPLGPVAIRGNPLLLSGGGPQVGSKGGVVGVKGGLDHDFADWRLAGLVIQANLLEIGDIGEDAVVVGLVGVERGGLGGLGAGHVGRGARDLAVRMALCGNHIFVRQSCRGGRGQREGSFEGRYLGGGALALPGRTVRGAGGDGSSLRGSGKGSAPARWHVLVR